jgi:aspartate aminotransferase
MAARAAALRAQGRTVFDFSAGEPDFAPPVAVREAVAKLVRERPIGYTPVAGMAALREAVAAHLSAYHGTSITPSRVLVSCGAKHSIANLLQATIDPGDEVVIPVPAWVSYPDMVRLAEGVPVLAPTLPEHGWRLQPDVLAKHIGPRTRMLILNSPGNPTGGGYRAEDLRAIGEVLAKHAPQTRVMADDIYRRLTYGAFEHASIVRTLGGTLENLSLVDGVSKTYAMTGFRIGFLVDSESVVTAATRVQGQTTSGAATPSQHAALAALVDPSVEAEVVAMHEAFTRRRETMLAALSAIPGIRIVPPDGAFYMWFEATSFLGRTGLADDTALANWLLDRHGVASVPGSAFSAPGYLRLSYATDDASVAGGCAAIAEALVSLAAHGAE